MKAAALSPSTVRGQALKRALVLGATVLALSLSSRGVGRAQEPGVSDERILFGQSAAFSGPAAELGTEFRLGLLAAFRARNRRGGINGRNIELVSLDDTYEPELAALNTRRLIEREGVFALIGMVGAPTSRSALPVAAESNVPFVAPFSGAGVFRERQYRNVVNLRASYQQEIEEIVARLIADLGIVRIGLLYQDDSFGRDILASAQTSMSGRGLELAGLGTFHRNTLAVKTAVLDLRAGRPGAVIVAGTSEAVGAAAAWSRRIGFNPVFATLSFAGGRALVNALGDEVRRVFVTQVVPFPMDDLPAAESFRAALKAVNPDAVPNFISFEGYLAGRLAVVGLQRCGETVTRELFLQKLLQGPVTLDGLRLRFGRNDNQGLDQVFLTMIGSDRQLRPVTGFDAGGAR